MSNPCLPTMGINKTVELTIDTIRPALNDTPTRDAGNCRQREGRPGLRSWRPSHVFVTATFTGR
jgi:hypothetical protein